MPVQQDLLILIWMLGTWNYRILFNMEMIEKLYDFNHRTGRTCHFLM